MKLVILAAGEGIRMRPLTLTTPKPLLVYKGRTALDHLFTALPAEIDQVIIVVKYLGNQIRLHCGSEFYGRPVSYVDGDSNGNALGFLKSKDFFSAGERFAVAYADDVVTSKEIHDCLACEYSWLCYEVADPRSVGVVTLDETGRVIAMVEKPSNSTSNLAADGFMVVNTDIFTYDPILHSKGEFYFSDLMIQFANDHEVIAIIGDPMHTQLTSPEDIERLNNR